MLKADGRYLRWARDAPENLKESYLVSPRGPVCEPLIKAGTDERRRLIKIVGFTAESCCMGSGAPQSASGLCRPLAPRAQDKTLLEWIVDYAAGSGPDIVARTVGKAMSQVLKQSIVINNRPCAATNSITDYVAVGADLDLSHS